MLLKELKELYEEKKKDRDDSIANGVLSEFLNGEFTMLEKIIYRMENKRKPLSDGTLPLTESELAEFGKIISTQLKNIRLKYDKNVECITYEGEGKSGKTGAGLLYNVKAIAYLLERFELIKED